MKQGAAIMGEQLSARELEILELTGRALSTKTVARHLDISTGTVRWHLCNIFSKMDAHTREQAVVRGRELGLIR